MENINIEVIWKEIDQLINQAEIIFFEKLYIIEDTEQLPIDVFRNKLDKSTETLYVYIMKILEKINFIIRKKLFNKFFIWEINEIIAILNYSYEWLQKNFVPNKIQYSDIHDYNYWKNISFFKLIISCLDKTSFAIYCLENTEIKNIRNTVKSREELIKQIKQRKKTIKFHNLVDKLKNDKESIKFFNELKTFYERVTKSTFWNMSKDFRNNLEHQMLSYDNKISNFNDFIIGNVFVNLKLLWFINIKSNVINPTHIEKLFSDNDYRKLCQILKCIADIKNKLKITNDTPSEIKSFSHDWIKAEAGQKIDWSKHSFIDKTILNTMISLVDQKHQKQN